ncbi:MAG: hypothetical protein NTV31_04335 [Bacteroidia bacterium]|nr:hypothetical protein [Bacteroidia bacterium]
MKYIAFSIGLILLSQFLYAQCFEKFRNEAIKEYNSGNYSKAKDFLSEAGECNDVVYPNDINEWIKKCNEKLDYIRKDKFDKTYGGSSTDEAQSIIQTTDGGYAMAGFTLAKEDDNIWVLKLDQMGEIVWDKTYGGLEDDEAKSIIQTNDGGYAVVGYTESKGSGGSDVWILKLNQLGEILWDKTYGGATADEANSIIQTTDGGYAVTGYTSSKESTNYYDDTWNRINSKNIWILKLNQLGEIVWDKTYGGTRADEAKSIIQTIDGGYAVVGYTESKGSGGSDIWILKLNQLGEILWDKTYGGATADEANSIIQTTDAGYAIAGWTTSKNPNKEDFPDLWVLKLNQMGEIIWDKMYGGHSAEGNSIIQTTDGGYAVAGYIGSKGAGNADFWVLKLDQMGEIVLDKTYGGIDSDIANSIIQTIDGGYIVAGLTYSKGAGWADIWVLKLDNKGNIWMNNQQNK